MLDLQFFLKIGPRVRDRYRDHIFRNAKDVFGKLPKNALPTIRLKSLFVLIVWPWSQKQSIGTTSYPRSPPNRIQNTAKVPQGKYKHFEAS